MFVLLIVFIEHQKYENILRECLFKAKLRNEVTFQNRLYIVFHD